MARSEAPASAKAAGNSYPLRLPPPRQSSTLLDLVGFPPIGPKTPAIIDRVAAPAPRPPARYGRYGMHDPERERPILHGYAASGALACYARPAMDPAAWAGDKRLGEYERRDAEFDRFRVYTLRAPERFADTVASDEETLRLGGGNDLRHVGPNSVTIMLRLSTSCAGWRDPPTAAEFHDAVRAPEPTARQRAILGAFAREADWRELIAAWAERAYTIRELVTALHRAGHAKCRAARWINGWAQR